MKPMSYDFRSRRSMVAATGGMVGTSSPLAAQAGLQILKRGGNAADAAIATAAVLNVVEPASTGIGGDCFALFFDAKTGHLSALNGSGRAPAALTAAVVRRGGVSAIPNRSPHAVSVPGTVAGWTDLLAKHGRMTLGDVLVDAIHYARDGYPVSPLFAGHWGRAEAGLRAGSYTEEYLPGGRAPRAGELVRLPALARSLQAIADGGPSAFYEGEIADAIVSTLRSLGGVMTKADLREHRSTWETPISVDYRGVTIYECPPNGQGLAALQALHVASQWDIGALPWDSPERLHLLVEAMRLAFADARHYIADNATDPAPLDFLLSHDYAVARAALVSPTSAMQPPEFGTPIAGSDTVYLSVVDGEGNACSFINSLYAGFGSNIVAEGTGIMLQNRGALFTLEEGHPNYLQPRKRPYHTIIPGMALKDGALWASFGVMGGFMQPQGHLQVISAMIDDDLNPQDALDRPRFCLMDGTNDSELALEVGIPVASMAALAALGHRVRPISGEGRALFGDGHIIRRDADTGVLFGGSDPRKDGLTVAY